MKKKHFAQSKLDLNYVFTLIQKDNKYKNPIEEYEDVKMKDKINPIPLQAKKIEIKFMLKFNF